MKPKVSLYIIAYNQAKFIEETLTSALTQEYENLEVVVADDGSTDGTADIILHYAKKFPLRLVPLVGGPNLGITGNCNRALQVCTGKYIANQGGDDVLLPGKIAKQVAWLEEDERRILCGHDVRVIYSDVKGKEFIRAEGGAGRNGKGAGSLIEHGVGSFFMGTSMMWRAGATPKSGFDCRLTMVSDWKFIVDLIGVDGLWGSIDGTYALYRRHDNNITHVGLKTVFRESLKSIYLLKREYPCYLRELAIAKIEVLYRLAQFYYRTGNTRCSRRLSLALLRTTNRNEKICKAQIAKLYFKALIPAKIVKLTHSKY